MNNENILGLLDKLFDKELLPHELRTLYDNCKMLSGLQLRYPELSFMKWMDEKDFEIILEKAKERMK